MSDMLRTAGTIREIERLRAIVAELLAALEAARGAIWAESITDKVEAAIAKAKGETP